MVTFIRIMALIAVSVLYVPFAIVLPGTTLDAWAGPDDPIPLASPSAGAPDGQPVPSDPASAKPHEEEKQTAPSLSGQTVTGPTATTPSSPAAPSPHPNVDQGLVDELYGDISRGFLSSAVWLDSFFGDERYQAEVNQSYFKLRFDAFREGSGGMDYLKPNFELRLVLPQLRQKTRLVISGDPNMDIDTTKSQPAVPAPGTQLQQSTRRVTTALQYVPVETTRSNFSIRAGVKLHAGEIAILAGPRYRYLIPLDPWELRFTQEVIWSSDMRWQSRTRFDLERPLPYDLFFRSSLEGLWSENVFGYPYALSFILRKPLDSNRALQYEWVNSFQTWPTNLLVEELFVFRFRQRFWRDWMFLEIAPQVRFPRDSGFTYTPGILFRIEMVFGNIRNIF